MKNIILRATLLLILAYSLTGCHNPTKPGDDDQILPFRIIDSEPSWSPDGETIAYIHDQTIDSTGQWSLDTSGIYLINADGTNKCLLLAGIYYSPDWSSNGEWIVFNQGTHIYKIKTDGDSLTKLTFEGRNFFPAWSPNGKWIAYENINCGSIVEPAPPNSYGVLIIESSGLGKKFVVNGRMPDWSPYGEYLIYVGFHNEIYRVNIIDTTEVIQLTSLNQNDIYAVDNRYPKYSPDGSRIVFESNAQIWVMDSDGYNLLQLTEKGGTYPSWSPDGKYIVYTHNSGEYSSDNGYLWIMSSDVENKRQLTFGKNK